jgi:hypothetical protein
MPNEAKERVTWANLLRLKALQLAQAPIGVTYGSPVSGYLVITTFGKNQKTDANTCLRYRPGD